MSESEELIKVKKELEETKVKLNTTSKALEKLENQLCFIWSPEHVGWWGVERQGYSRSVRNAGLYTRYEAEYITLEGNKYRAHDDFPYETIVPMHCSVGMQEAKLV
jgi:hypothetical protein